MGVSAQYGAAADAVAGVAGVHAGGACCSMHSATVRAPNTDSTTAGDDGHVAYKQALPMHPDDPGPHADAGAGPHHGTIRVAKRACCNRGTTPAVTVRAFGGVPPSGWAPAAAPMRAACSTADTSALFCTAQSPASIDARKQTRNSGSTKANSSVACDRSRRRRVRIEARAYALSRDRAERQLMLMKPRTSGVTGATFTGFAGWPVFGSTNVIQLPLWKISNTYGPPGGIESNRKLPSESDVVV